LSEAWEKRASAPALAEGDVHLWRFKLDASEVLLERAARLLTDDERERAARFRFDVHRDRFVAARAMLRVLLGAYLGAAPDAVRFAYEAHGKPGLASGELRFNASHSHDSALLGVTRGRELGVDLERIRADVRWDDVERQFFARAEQDALARYEGDLHPPAFFACWTRKEAYVKARGEGLSLPLDAFDVDVAPSARDVALRVPADPALAARWQLRAFSPWPDYAAAVAAEPPWSPVLLEASLSAWLTGQNVP
jgi:4'-phosphopantetheinyl transferase